MSGKGKKAFLLFFAVLLWLFGVSLTYGTRLKYDLIPGVQNEATASWPAGGALSPSADRRLTLLCFVHGKCPCSKATLSELAKIMEKHRSDVAARVVFYSPDGERDWKEHEYRRFAASIPGVAVFDDRNRSESSRFGSATSGEVFLYGRGGQLLFRGGITGSRGHAGDNPGEDALCSIISEGEAENLQERRFPVFGCSIAGSEKN